MDLSLPEPNAALPVGGVCPDCSAPMRWSPGTTQVRCEYCGSGLAIDAEANLVALQCPSCSGNFCYVDGALVGQCPYCSARLLALTRERLLRYAIRPRVERPAGAADGELWWLPFWRLSGLVFAWDIGKQLERVPAGQAVEGAASGPEEISPRATAVDRGPQKQFRSRVVQLALPDPAARQLGVQSLRLRAAVFPLEPFSLDHERLGRVVPPWHNIAAARADLWERALDSRHATAELSVDCQRADLVAETLSLLYYPFWIAPGARERRIWDAVTGAPEPLAALPVPLVQAAANPTVFDEMKVIELRCAHCGGELVTGQRAVVLPCRDCHTSWVAGRQGLQPFGAHFARPQLAAPSAGAKLRWLPFWEVAVRVQYCGRLARRAGDLRAVLEVRLPPGPRGRLPAPDAPLTYFAPAYGSLRAGRLDVVARDMTRLQPVLEVGPFREGQLMGSFFGPEDAHALGYVSWIGLLPGAVTHRLRSLRLVFEQTQLWYVPFAEQGRELINLLTGGRYDSACFLRGAS
ncbi:MAG: hypothetical protein IPL40_00770 [Proteobacteria bacterium]|nr:hypothetical protein [Pseudomonadota bacterium]